MRETGRHDNSPRLTRDTEFDQFKPKIIETISNDAINDPDVQKLMNDAYQKMIDDQKNGCNMNYAYYVKNFSEISEYIYIFCNNLFLKKFSVIFSRRKSGDKFNAQTFFITMYRDIAKNIIIFSRSKNTEKFKKFKKEDYFKTYVIFEYIYQDLVNENLLIGEFYRSQVYILDPIIRSLLVFDGHDARQAGVMGYEQIKFSNHNNASSYHSDIRICMRLIDDEVFYSCVNKTQLINKIDQIQNRISYFPVLIESIKKDNFLFHVFIILLEYFFKNVINKYNALRELKEEINMYENESIKKGDVIGLIEKYKNDNRIRKHRGMISCFFSFFFEIKTTTEKSLYSLEKKVKSEKNASIELENIDYELSKVLTKKF